MTRHRDMRRSRSRRLLRQRSDGSVTFTRDVKVHADQLEVTALEVAAAASTGATAVTVRAVSPATLRSGDVFPEGLAVTIDGTDYVLADEARVIAGEADLTLDSGLVSGVSESDAVTISSTLTWSSSYCLVSEIDRDRMPSHLSADVSGVLMVSSSYLDRRPKAGDRAVVAELVDGSVEDVDGVETLQVYFQ